MKISLLLFILGLFQFSLLAVADEGIYRTSTGATFTSVEIPGFGRGWKDPDGIIWSSVQGSFTNEALSEDKDMTIVDSPATRACAKIGATLPSIIEFKGLVAHFDYRNGTRARRDLTALFPGLANSDYIWTSTVAPESEKLAFLFEVSYGIYNRGTGIRLQQFPVICVR